MSNDSNPNKRLAAAIFIVAYLLPLSALFFLSIAVVFTGWIPRFFIIGGFGLPLAALWGYSGMAEAPIFLIGLAGVPAGLFSAAVLFKAWKERQSSHAA